MLPLLNASNARAERLLALEDLVRCRNLVF